VTDLDVLVAQARTGELAAVGIDMPIGLPVRTPRASDRELRVHLGARRSTLFPTPPRAVLGAADYRDALTRAREAIGVGLSKQAWNLVDKIRALDELMTPDLQPRISEAHPESSFAELAGAPLATRKATAAGRHERIEWLRPAFADIDERVSSLPAIATDVVDAFAAAWTARRIALGTARWFGDDTRDERGLQMRVAV
jgi:predicted RNase H-like nuclease